jgi:hypothetical protein
MCMLQEAVRIHTAQCDTGCVKGMAGSRCVCRVPRRLQIKGDYRKHMGRSGVCARTVETTVTVKGKKLG